MPSINNLDLVLYLEGVRVPVVTANVRSTMGTPTYANIELLPDMTLSNILPRTMVHLFIKDPNSIEEEKPWVLFFEGEVFGVSYRKMESGRAGMLQAMGNSSYWDNAKQYFVNLRNSSYGQMDTSRLGSEMYLKKEANINRIAYEQSVHDSKAWIVNKVNDVLKNPNNDLLDAIAFIVKKLQDVNSFFRFGDARQRISDRMIFMSSGNMNKLINIAKKEAIMNSIFGRGNGGKFTLRQMINMIMGLVFHDFSSLTSPSKVKSDTSMPIGTNLVPNSFIFKPSSFMLTPPRCNVVMPHMYNHLAYDRNYFHEVSRVTMQPMQAIWENNKPRAFMKTYYAPNDIEKFMVPESKAADTLNPQDAGPPGQGNYKDELDKKNSATTKKRDFHYFSYEEILKGIFHEMGHATPNSSTFSRYMNEAEQGSFYQQATDYLFHEKRYAARNTTTSGPLNIAPVVGFPIMIMDDSPANQTIIGVLQSISHSVGAKSGASTSYTITFSRPLFEPDMWTGEYTEPPIPPWYDKKIFGDRRGVRDTDWNKLPKKYHNQFEKSVKNVNDYSNIGNYYTKVLGDSGPSYLTGHKPLTTKNFPITLSATYSLIEKYNAIADQDKFLYTSKYTARDYVKFHEIFGFLGADNLNESASYSLNPPKEVNGTRFNGGYVDNTGDDLNSIDKNLKKYFGPEAFKRRRAAVKQYRDIVLSRKATT